MEVVVTVRALGLFRVGGEDYGCGEGCGGLGDYLGEGADAGFRGGKRGEGGDGRWWDCNVVGMGEGGSGGMFGGGGGVGVLEEEEEEEEEGHADRDVVDAVVMVVIQSHGASSTMTEMDAARGKRAPGSWTISVA